MNGRSQRKMGVALGLSALLVAGEAALAVTITGASGMPADVRQDGILIRAVPLAAVASSEAPVGLANAHPSTATFSATGTAPGTIDVATYAPSFASGGSTGGARLRATYDAGAAPATDVEYRWLQQITTNVPLGGTTSPYLDPRPDTDDLPFYYDDVPPGLAQYDIEDQTSADGARVSYFDFSKRHTSNAANTPVTWQANLHVVEYNRDTDTGIIRDGLTWGWEILADIDVEVDMFGSTPFDTSDFFRVSFAAGPDDVFLEQLILDVGPAGAFFDVTNAPPGAAGSPFRISNLSGVSAADITDDATNGSSTLSLAFADSAFGVDDSFAFGVDVDLFSAIDSFGATPDELADATVTFLFSDGYSLTSGFDRDLLVASSLAPDLTLPQGVDGVTTKTIIVDDPTDCLVRCTAAASVPAPPILTLLGLPLFYVFLRRGRGPAQGRGRGP